MDGKEIGIEGIDNKRSDSIEHEVTAREERFYICALCGDRIIGSYSASSDSFGKSCYKCMSNKE